MSETDYGSRLPGQLALRQVGKVGHTVPCQMQVFGRPGQLALWQVDKADKYLRDWSITDPSGGVDLPSSKVEALDYTVGMYQTLSCPGSVTGYQASWHCWQVGKVSVAAPVMSR